MRAGFLHSLAASCVIAGLLPCGASAQSQDSAPAGSVRPAQTAASPANAARPRIGLVLSGGGARGGAHVGVLKALEELRIPVDVIAGTSIGAAVGGLYASGLSTAEIEDFIEGIDWDSAFLNTTPRRLRSFRRKRDDDLFLVEQKPGLNNGEFELPTGVVQGQVIDTIMSRVTLPVAGVDDFDDLAIPFRAVAGNLETGEAVILGSGDLGRAIRASMSVPAAFTPMEIDGQLLVDGGIVMNLPVEVAHNLGADVIIAVDISDTLQTRDELRSIVDVTAQLTSLLTRQGTLVQRDLLADDDVLLTPEFAEDYSPINFSRIAETIDNGYEIAMEHRAELERFSLSAPDYAAHVAARRDPRESELPTIDFVRWNDTSLLAHSVIEARIKEIEIGVPLDVDALETSLNRLYGLELYQNVRYELVEDGDSRGLELDMIERSWGPNYLQLGLQYSSATGEDTVFGLSASYLRTAINERGGEWRATFFLGDEPAFLADLYQPLGSQALWFVAPAFRVESNVLNLFEGDVLAAETRLREVSLEVALGRELLDWGEVRAGVRRGYGDVKLRVGDPAVVPIDEFRTGELFARFSVDTLDAISFPREGFFATAEWRGSRTGALSADADFDQLLVDLAVARTWGRHTVFSTLRYDATVSGTAPPWGLFRFGGFLDFSGLNRNQLSGQHVARIGTSYYRRIGDLVLFPAFAGVSIEYGNVWSSRSDISAKGSMFGASLWAGVDTPVGPIYLGYGVAEGGDNAIYAILGRVF